MADQDVHRLGGADPASPGGETQPHAAGPKLTVDFGEANQALTHLEEAFKTLDKAYRFSYPIEEIENPGREQPSTGFAGAANPVGKQKRGEIRQQYLTVKAMYDTLQAQLDSQRSTEETNAAILRRAGG